MLIKTAAVKAPFQHVPYSDHASGLRSRVSGPPRPPAQIYMRLVLVELDGSEHPGPDSNGSEGYEICLTYCTHIACRWCLITNNWLDISDMIAKSPTDSS